MTREFDDSRVLLTSAKVYWDVFPVGSASEVKRRYRQLMKRIHPDQVAGPFQVTAHELVCRLDEFHRDALEAMSSGTYGTRKALATLSSKYMEHTFYEELQVRGDIAKLYAGESRLPSGECVESLFKIAQSHRDNDLLAAEAATLRYLQENAAPEFRAFYPEIVDSLAVKEDRRRMRVNILRHMEGFVTLEGVRRHRPDGLRTLDAVWVWRRLLWALGGAHETGVVHGAVVPSHVMIHPALHGVMLVDWCYSQRSADHVYGHIKAVVPARKAWYPPRVFERQPTSELADCKMAARCMIYLLGGDAVSMTLPREVPESIRTYLVGIITSNDVRSAFELLAQFDEVLVRLGAPYHPRQFRELVL